MRPLLQLQLGLQLILLSVRAADLKNKPLSVLMIVVDDLRPELQPYGYDTIKTPNIEKFAESALTFTQAHVQQAVCSPR